MKQYVWFKYTEFFKQSFNNKQRKSLFTQTDTAVINFSNTQLSGIEQSDRLSETLLRKTLYCSLMKVLLCYYWD